MKKLINHLNQAVANFGVLYTKLHNYHWFVEGPQFYNLHEMFEKLYDEVTENFDAVAERILMLGDKPVATLKEFLEFATIKEASGKESVREMLQVTVADYASLNKELSDTIVLAQELGDEVTVDLLLDMVASIQKHLWMLKATLK